MSINTIIIIIILSIMALVGAGVCAYVYLRDKSLEDIREDVYKLFLQAEHTYLETGSGRKKMQYVIHRARSLLPNWMQFFVTEELLEKVIEGWFRGVKDLLDDGKLNSSAEREEVSDNE